MRLILAFVTTVKISRIIKFSSLDLDKTVAFMNMPKYVNFRFHSPNKVQQAFTSSFIFKTNSIQYAIGWIVSDKNINFSLILVDNLLS